MGLSYGVLCYGAWAWCGVVWCGVMKACLLGYGMDRRTLELGVVVAGG